MSNSYLGTYSFLTWKMFTSCVVLAIANGTKIFQGSQALGSTQRSKGKKSLAHREGTSPPLSHIDGIAPWRGGGAKLSKDRTSNSPIDVLLTKALKRSTNS
ncbi:hypothetical protein KIL84_019139 [Mauremys mutica]|uniref:Uncharacterized protein n=1 Tax=Mauremys mutica TaxID=74926 RepID=A0A9D4BAD7_9SAUR|nr:hypothetical protein KIL84_019139 [Mauremys mutica]